MIHSFLMIGQSNMAGRGYAKEVPPIFDEHIKMQRNGLWQIMSEPINFDRPSSGVSLASSFAAAWRLDNEQDEIGLIPCADGGTSLDDWAVGSALFENAVSQARLAQRTSEIKGILWHQGESDCSPEKAEKYQEKFSEIINALRQKLNIPEVPLIIGGLGDFLPKGILGQYFIHYSLVNRELEYFAQSHENCYFVTAKDLDSNPDGIHFNAHSQRLLGIRYYQAYRDLKDISNPIADEENTLNTIYNRPYTRTEKIKLLEHEFAIGNIESKDYLNKLTALSQE
ncbi:sialate O-acetylesterase [Chryseobacterium sp. KCF3-3]|uniref:sialate O-acetylesterase n=1 Tax=Chryseobacterium sp. KCF3-3 TaxID=3231511 RepID=UPI0038B2960C